jgi:peptidyl-prolyl cis-trans isomerase SurA
LQEQEAERLGIKVEDAEIQAAVSRIETQNNMRPGQLIQMLTQRNIDANTLVDQIRATLAWRKAVSQRLRTQVTIGEDDIDAYLQNLQEKGGTEYLLGEIFIAANTPAELPRARATAERLVQDMRRGTPFTEMARQFSQAPTAGAGGDTGWVTAGQLESQVAEAVTKLQPGQVSPPVGVSDGYYLIALRDSRTFGPDGEQETVYDLRRVFLAYPPGANQQQQRDTLIRLARARPGLNNCAAVERYATQAGDPQNGNMGKLSVAQMPEGLRPLILGLEPGKISQLYRLQDGGLVMMLCGKETRSLGLPTRDAVRENLLQREADIIARRYMRELRQDAIIQTIEERT